MTLSGKTVLITGAACRIGAAVAKHLAALGATVIIHYRNSEADALALLDSLRAGGFSAFAIQADFDNPDEAGSIVSRVLPLTDGHFDAIVNNASAYPLSSSLSVTDSEIAASMRVHVSSPLAIIQRFAALPHPEGAAIVNMLDARITADDSQHAAYHLAKRSLFTLTRMLALELAPNIRVNAVAPGAVLQENGHAEEELKRLAQFNPLKSHGSPEGVADCVAFLLTSEFITGQTIYYDGGYHLKSSLYGP